MELPEPLRKIFSHFPVYSHPAILPKNKITVSVPTIWILPPRDPGGDLLSRDVECLKWQAYLALRGLTNIRVRWDIAPEGGAVGRLPNLHVPLPGDSSGEGDLLAPPLIPGWVDGQITDHIDPLEGYRDEYCRDESHAWVSLLEGKVHAALVLSEETSLNILSLVQPNTTPIRPVESLLTPPPAPASGFSSIFPPYGVRISYSAIHPQYIEAIASLSERLGQDKWFLGSQNATALDALVFAYIHCILHANDNIRIEVTRRVNLVTWERRVRTQVCSAFERQS